MQNKEIVTLTKQEFAAFQQQSLELSLLHKYNIELTEKYHLAEVARAKAEAEKKEALIKLIKAEANSEKLEEEMNIFRKFVKAFYERKSERYIGGIADASQLNLFTAQIIKQAELQQIAEVKPINRTRKSQKGRHPGRRPIPDHLPRRRIVIEPEGDFTGWVKIGEEITEELDYQPGYFFINEFVRPKYARPSADENAKNVIIAPPPIRVIDKGIPGPNLLAHMLVSKFVDHLPWYRQLSIFSRSGVEIDEMTANGWMKKATELLQVIYDRMWLELLIKNYLMADESTVNVLDPKLKGKTHLGYYWVYMDPVTGLTIFVYEKGRAGVFVRTHLADFSGFLQTDAYSGYDRMPLANQGLVLLGCWAHARRKFYDALKTDKKNSDWFVDKIQLLYKIERFARTNNMDAAERLVLRTNSIIILEEMKVEMLEIAPKLTPKSDLNIAIQYAINNWDELMVFTTDGRLEIDNNLVENRIRPLAIGRKNYLFAGSHEAAQRNGVIYSITATCKSLAINPFAYLADVLDRLPARNINNIEDLLPWNWAEDKKNR